MHNTARAAPQGAAAPPTTNPDDRVITARGTYDLSFFDTDNEYETYGMEQMQRRDGVFEAFFQRYVTHLSSDFVSDADFDREFTYERLSELDERLVRRGGLSAHELRRLLAPVRGVCETCPICLEESAAKDKMARLACGHTFHCRCLAEWLGQHHSCPLCRKDLRVAGSSPAQGAATEAPARRPTESDDESGDDDDESTDGEDDGGHY